MVTMRGVSSGASSVRNGRGCGDPGRAGLPQCIMVTGNRGSAQRGRPQIKRWQMRRHTVLGALVAGLLVAGCSGQGNEADNGWSMMVAQDYAGARAHYESLLASNPNDPYVNLNLGVAYEELGDKAMAAKHYQVALANGKDSGVSEIAEDGSVAGRRTTVAKVAEENLAGLGS